MAVSSDTLRLHLSYTSWASLRLLTAASVLTEEELNRDFKTSDRCILDTLVHVFAADRMWLARIHGESPATFVTPEDRNFTRLQREWPAPLERWKDWAEQLGDRDGEATIAYRDLKGNPWESALWKIVLHVVNHGTHHRGQVSGFLRTLGHTPPQLDLIAYYRELYYRELDKRNKVC